MSIVIESTDELLIDQVRPLSMPLIPMLLVLWFLCPKTISRKRTKTEVLAMRDHPFQRLKTRFEPQRHLKPHCVPRSRTPLTFVCCSAPQIGQDDGLLIFCGFPVFLRIAPQIKPSDPSKTSFAIDFHDERVRVIRPAPEVIRDLNWDRKLDLIEVNGDVFTMRVGRGKAVQILSVQNHANAVQTIPSGPRAIQKISVRWEDE